MNVNIRLLSLLLACGAGVALYQDGLYGEIPDKYACLCVTADNMNVREKPCGNIKGNAQKDRCVRFTGRKNQCKMYGQGAQMVFFQVYMDKEKLWLAGAFLTIGEEEYCVDNDEHDMPFPYPPPPPPPRPPPPPPSPVQLSFGRLHNHHNHQPQARWNIEVRKIPTGTKLENGQCLCATAKRVSVSATKCGPETGFMTKGNCFRYTGKTASCTTGKRYQVGFLGGGYVSGKYMTISPPFKCPGIGGDKRKKISRGVSGGGKCSSAVSEIVDEYGDDIPFGLYVPQCDDKGGYLPLQTNGGTGYRWCADSDGVEIPGTSVPPGNPAPDCGDNTDELSTVVGPVTIIMPLVCYLKHLDEDALAATFNLFDFNSDDVVSADELQTFPFYKHLDLSLFQELVDNFDQDGNGVLDQTEFTKMMGQGCTID